MSLPTGCTHRICLDSEVEKAFCTLCADSTILLYFFLDVGGPLHDIEVSELRSTCSTEEVEWMGVDLSYMCD